MPPEIQDGASNGYYRQPRSMARGPAIYFINLKSTGDWPKYSLPALTYHEGVPGHHLQLSIAQLSGDLPMLRRIAFYSAYGEGWALYSEQLADELGGYKGIERAGYLQSFLFRAERLVVDTGLNAKRWTPRAGDRPYGQRPPASRARASSGKSSAIAPRRARPAATRSATSPGPSSAPRRKPRSGRSSTCASSTKSSTKARCR